MFCTLNLVYALLVALFFKSNLDAENNLNFSLAPILATEAERNMVAVEVYESCPFLKWRFGASAIKECLLKYCY